MASVQRELLACSKPPPQPTRVLPLGVVVVLGAVWLALSPLSAAKPAPSPAVAAQPSPAARWFNKIQLEGVGGVPPRRVAIINGQTLRQGEWTMIKVAGRDVGIRCKSILGDTATIAIDDVAGTTTLHLRQGAGETQTSYSRR